MKQAYEVQRDSKRDRHPPAIRDRSQISLLISSEFKQINFYFPGNHQETYGFLMISGRIEVH